MTALAGANLIYGLGMLEMGVTFDFGQLVMDNEFAKMIKCCVQGIPVNDETLSLGAIKEIGPFKDFMSHETTYQYMKSISHPKLIDRRNRDKWQARGGTSLYERALEEAKRIVSKHEVPPLPEDVRSSIRTIVEETEDHHGVERHQPPF
jgi:trimethylamine--corrinoid protein Co-methyltransferase